MAATLSQYVLLQSKSNHKYLQFVHQQGILHGYLRFSGVDAVSPYTKFQVQVSESDQTLVHLRSCYNNKYWVPSAVDQVESFVLAAANEPEEDQTKLSCTLFRPMPVAGDSKALRFMHVNSKKYVALSTMIGPVTSCIYLASETPNQDLHDVFTVIDWSSLVIFPKNIALRDSARGKYLCVRPVKEVKYLQFVADDLGDRSVGQEVLTCGAGNISIRSQLYNTLWTRAAGNFIIANTQDNDVTNQNILFSPARVLNTENVFALKSLGNDRYCKSLDFFTPAGDEVHGLSAEDATITTLSHLEVVNRATASEAALEASDFRVSDARVITVPTLVVLGAGEVTNDSDVDVDMKVEVSYVRESLTRTWSSTANGSLKVGITVVGVTSPIPDEVNGKIVITDTTTSYVVWGVEDTESRDTTVKTVEVRVPALTKATVQAMGEKKLWDIPFSYIQTITLYGGDISGSKIDDGIYTGTRTTLQAFKIEFGPVK